MKKAKDVVETSEKESPKASKPARRDMLSTGSTLLNLACSGNPFGGFVKGKYYYLVGDSTSGKTFLSMTCFAEAMIHRHFKNYRLVYDNVEDGMLMDVEKLFGKAVGKRIEAPSKDKAGNPVFSYTIEEFYYHLDDLIKEGKPFIYVLDSMDGLSSTAELEKFDAHKKAYRSKEKSPGSYGDGKAKKNSEGIRKVLNDLRNSGSILIIISQTRDSLGTGFSPKTHSGGHALEFYATLQLWTSIAEQIKKTVRNKARNIGVKVKIKTKKNRITGKTGEVQIAIYPSYGIDDIGTCVDYLVSEKWWKCPTKQTIEAGEFDITASREALIQKIEKEGWEDELRSIVGKCWKEIEAASNPNRKNKYA